MKLKPSLIDKFLGKSEYKQLAFPIGKRTIKDRVKSAVRAFSINHALKGKKQCLEEEKNKF